MNNQILIIDDDINLATALAEILFYEGYETTIATSGLAGLRHIRKFAPDLVICDWEMPNFNGGELRRLLQLSDETKHVPFIFITGHAIYATEFKSAVVLTKPVSIYTLVDVIKEELEVPA